MTNGAMIAVRVPGDKSISHRALICAALATGRSRIRNILPSADVHSTAGVLRALGVGIPPLGATLRIDGRGLGGLRAPGAELDCGNSGTTARLMSGVLSGHPFSARLIGDESLSRRPMARVAKPLTAMGATFAFDAGEHLPMVVTGGALRPIDWSNAAASAQVKSAILFAALVARVPASVTEPVRSRDHTERMLAALGVELRSCGGEAALTPASELSAFQLDVPADPSSAAFLAALGAAGGVAGGSIQLTDVALNPTRLGFFRVLREMGADVVWETEREECGEPVGSITIGPAALDGVEIEAEQVPAMIDELPLLACLATRARGETVIRGASELRVKESDRIAAVVQNLRAVGADADELPDGLIVRGAPGSSLGGSVRAHGDHRLAMGFGVLGALSGGAIHVDDRDCVNVSYPDFWSDLDRVTA